MIVFRYFCKNLWKYKWSLFIYILIFGAISLFNMPTPKEKIYQEKWAKVGVIDDDNRSLSKDLFRYLQEGNHVSVYRQKEEMEEQVFIGGIDLGVIIPKGFSEDPLQHKIKLIKNNQNWGNAIKVNQEIMGYMELWRLCQLSNGQVDYELLHQGLKEKVEVRMVEDEKTKYQSIFVWQKKYVNASSYLIISLIILSIGMGPTDFKEEKVMFRNDCSGYKVISFQSQIFLAQMIVGFFIWMMIMLIMMVMSGKENLSTDFFLYGLNVFVFILTILSFNFLLNYLVKKKEIVIAIANIFSLGSSFLCGVFIPIELLSSTTLKFAGFLPSYYFVLANDAIFFHESTWWKNLMIQCLFSIVFLLMGIYMAILRQKGSAFQKRR